jgi:hypothetical protein
VIAPVLSPGSNHMNEPPYRRSAMMARSSTLYNPALQRQSCDVIK